MSTASCVILFFFLLKTIWKLGTHLHKFTPLKPTQFHLFISFSNRIAINERKWERILISNDWSNNHWFALKILRKNLKFHIKRVGKKPDFWKKNPSGVSPCVKFFRIHESIKIEIQNKWTSGCTGSSKSKRKR